MTHSAHDFEADQLDTAVEVVHRSYVSGTHAHYAGGLVDGAFVLARFGDAATDLCIQMDGDEGLFASYDDVQFRAPVRAGDVLEVSARLLKKGRRSRHVEFSAAVLSRSAERGSGASPSSSEVLSEPLIVTTARGTIVVPL